MWKPAQLTEVLGDADGALAARVFGVTDAGNFEHRTTVLSMPFPLAHVARSVGIGEPALQERLDAIRARLLVARALRPAPARDDKVLTSWNALMMAALAEAGASPDFLLRELLVDGVLLRTWKQGRAKITGFLEDSSFLADGLVTLYESTGDGDVLYDTASDAAPLLVRPRTIDDNPIPAGQSTLASALLRIAAITGDAELRSRAERIIAPLAAAVARSPLAVTAMACAVDRALARPREVAIVGPAADPNTRALVVPSPLAARRRAGVGRIGERPARRSVNGRRRAGRVCVRELRVPTPGHRTRSRGSAAASAACAEGQRRPRTC